MKLVQLIFIILLISSNSMGQINFQDHNIIDDSYGMYKPTAVVSIDVDGDLDLDLVAGNTAGGKLYVLENLDGEGNFGPPQIINFFTDGLRSIVATDMDFDGDMDLLTASFNNNSDDRIAWLENTDGAGNFGDQQIISANVDMPWSVFAADVDGDGDQDVLSASEGDDKIAWYENINGQGFFGSQQIIAINQNANNASEVFSADIDGDGDVDVFACYQNYPNDYLIWYENLDGQGNFGEEKLIANLSVSAYLSISSMFSDDIDNDGDMDLLVGSWGENKIVWYENLDGQGNFGIEQIISTEAGGPTSVVLSDIDGDDDVDVAFTSRLDDKVTWHENINGQGDFGPQQIISTNADDAFFIHAADLDGDNDQDIISVSFEDEKIAWYKNLDGQGDFGSQQVLTAKIWGLQNSPHLIDFDMDGDLDLLIPSGQGRRIAWFENEDGLGDFGEQIILTDSADKSSILLIADMDGDNEKDIISTSYSEDNIVWYKNSDGQLGAPLVISTEVVAPFGLTIFDIDNDNDLDVVSYSDGGQKLIWFENLNGLGDFGSQQIVYENENSKIEKGDLNGDGYIDLILGTANDSIFWLENTGVQGIFDSPKLITSDLDDIGSILTGDIDGDGDMDITTTSIMDGKIVWYENLDGQGNFGSQKTVDIINPGSFRRLFLIDVDLDGDLDLFSASFNGVFWYENLDGTGSFSEAYPIISGSGSISMIGGDIDGDNDIDLVSSLSGILNWHENLGPINSIFQKASIEFLIFPVPAVDNIFVQSDHPIKHLEIYDELGRMVFSNNGFSYLNISFLNTGTYFCKVIDEHGEWGIKKIVKQ